MPVTPPSGWNKQTNQNKVWLEQLSESFMKFSLLTRKVFCVFKGFSFLGEE
jgi:hypothetical protein